MGSGWLPKLSFTSPSNSLGSHDEGLTNLFLPNLFDRPFFGFFLDIFLCGVFLRVIFMSFCVSFWGGGDSAHLYMLYPPPLHEGPVIGVRPDGHEPGIGRGRGGHRDAAPDPVEEEGPLPHGRSVRPSQPRHQRDGTVAKNWQGRHSCHRGWELGGDSPEVCFRKSTPPLEGSSQHFPHAHNSIRDLHLSARGRNFVPNSSEK